MEPKGAGLQQYTASCASWAVVLMVWVLVVQSLFLSRVLSQPKPARKALDPSLGLKPLLATTTAPATPPKATPAPRLAAGMLPDDARNHKEAAPAVPAGPTASRGARAGAAVERGSLFGERKWGGEPAQQRQHAQSEATGAGWHAVRPAAVSSADSAAEEASPTPKGAGNGAAAGATSSLQHGAAAAKAAASSAPEDRSSVSPGAREILSLKDLPGQASTGAGHDQGQPQSVAGEETQGEGQHQQQEQDAGAGMEGEGRQGVGEETESFEGGRSGSHRGFQTATRGQGKGVSGPGNLRRLVGAGVEIGSPGPLNRTGWKPRDGVSSTQEVCNGRRIYMYDLPPKFHADMLANCDNRCENFCDSLCASLSYDALGGSLLPEDATETYDQQIVSEYEFEREDTNKSSAVPGAAWKKRAEVKLGDAANGTTGVIERRQYTFGPWQGTQQNMIGVIFLARMMQYECLTTDWRTADAFYVPALFGLKTLYGDHLPHKEIEEMGDELGEILSRHPGYKRNDGADHFLVVGQQIWDFAGQARRHKPGEAVWTSYLFYRNALMKSLFVSVERFVFEARAQSIPYATAFHPVTREDLEEWVEHVRGHPRPVLATLIAANRQGNLVRQAVTAQCDMFPSKCRRVDCARECPRGSCRKVVGVCGEPRLVASEYLSSQFCLVPNGDSATRRSSFDALLSGCIPVFFDPDSFHGQYRWYTGGKPANISVLFPKAEVASEELDFLSALQRIPEEDVERMRSAALGLLPGMVFRDHVRGGGKGEPGFKDAFDVAVEGILKHVKHPVTY